MVKNILLDVGEKELEKNKMLLMTQGRIISLAQKPVRGVGGREAEALVGRVREGGRVRRRIVQAATTRWKHQLEQQVRQATFVAIFGYVHTDTNYTRI